MKRPIQMLIIESLCKHGKASPTEIQGDLGSQYSGELGGALVRQALQRMVKRHIVDHVGYGRYGLSQGFDRRSKSIFVQMEEAITASLRWRGGIARTKDIRQDIWNRSNYGSDRPHEYRLITNTLKSSSLFHQDFGRGVWNLSARERGKLPMVGLWAARSIERNRQPGHGGLEWCEEERDEFFDRVGTAFAEARGERSLDGIIQAPEIRTALKELGLARGARDIALQELRDDIDRGIAPAIDLASSGRSRSEAILPYLYAMFEAGYGAVHMAACAGFYRACASFFQVCAAGLSRGLIRPLPAPL